MNGKWYPICFHKMHLSEIVKTDFINRQLILPIGRAGNYTNYSDPAQVARLKSAIDYMRKVEFDLARNLERLNQDDKYFFTEDNEVPGAFQKLVEEYFRSIAKSK